MDFPLADILGGLGLPILIILLMLSPAIIGTLIGQIIRFFRYIFGAKDDDDE